MRTFPLSTWRIARQFYEHTLGLKAKQEINGGVVYEFGKGTACFAVPDAERRHIEGQPGILDCRRDIAGEVAELTKRGVQFERYDVPEIEKARKTSIPAELRALHGSRTPRAISLAIIQNE